MGNSSEVFTCDDLDKLAFVVAFQSEGPSLTVHTAGSHPLKDDTTCGPCLEKTQRDISVQVSQVFSVGII